MKKFKIYYEYAEGEVYTTYKIGKSKNEVANKIMNTYGVTKEQIIKVVDVTNEYPIDIEKIMQTLKSACFGNAELDIIYDCLRVIQWGIENG